MLKDYILDLLKNNKTALKTAPAAKMHHHNYIGGLIQHIVECLEFSSIIKVFFWSIKILFERNGEYAHRIMFK